MFWANGQRTRREAESKQMRCFGQMGREEREKLRRQARVGHDTTDRQKHTLSYHVLLPPGLTILRDNTMRHNTLYYHALLYMITTTQAVKGSMRLMVGYNAIHQKHDGKVLVDLSRCCHVCTDNNKDCPSRRGLG